MANLDKIQIFARKMTLFTKTYIDTLGSPKCAALLLAAYL